MFYCYGMYLHSAQLQLAGSDSINQNTSEEAVTEAWFHAPKLSYHSTKWWIIIQLSRCYVPLS